MAERFAAESGVEQAVSWIERWGHAAR